MGNVETEEEKQALIEKYGNQALRPSVKMSKSLGNVVNPRRCDPGLRRGHSCACISCSSATLKDCRLVRRIRPGLQKRFLDRVWNLAHRAGVHR